ncbi:outer membrane beta-barrel family protein [Runella sp. MFBS21]|uniref:outer membrane beta-barrel family protein n=1 Tax=Runella sp. MFBS21 TaxID=3034018 RepID=UPI0023F8DA53|nr:outer membrane beta-barrel family protein [Runella sp. MFBS21]MDF7820697.1 outer membrane beta-barrel family protein [Runella sp. MFBS21]
MKNYKYIALGFVMMFGWGIGPTSAQQVGQLRGHLKAVETSKPIEFATVALFRERDSSLVKGTLSDTSGVFIFEKIVEGKYYLTASIIGYKSMIVRNIIVSEKTQILPVITLESEAQMIETVTVTAKKPLVEQQIDRTVLNIENSILAEGNTALELLEKAPGVTLDDDGNIALKGRTGVAVMLNGKLTYLSQRELTTLLRGTPSGAVSKIEIIANPSAKYDAAGNAGMINIVLKKSDKVGANGSIYANLARSRANRYGTGINLNYRNGGFNIYGSYDHAFRGEVEYVSYTRRFHDGKSGNVPLRTSYQNTTTNEPLYTNNYKAGVDFAANEKNIFGLLINGSFGTYINDNMTTNRLVSASGQLLSLPQTYNYNREQWNSAAFNFNYVHKPTRKNSELSMDLNYSVNHNRSALTMDTRYLTQENTSSGVYSLRRGNAPSLTYVYVGKVDYVHPFDEKSKLEMGWKSSYVEVDNNLKYDTLKNEQWIPDPSWSNHFKYQETIHAGYINYQKSFGKLNVQVGLRGEKTQTIGAQVTTDSVVKRSYFQLFPSLFVSNTFNDVHSAQLSYSRRIERPDYADLNPFRFFRDPFLYYEGNPFLRPELTHSVEVSHIYKGQWTTTLNYSYTSDVMNWMMGQVDSLNTTFQSPQNLRSFINYGISFTASVQPTHWWSLNSFANVFRNEYRGDQKGGNLNNGIWTFSLNIQNTFQLGKGYSAELSGYYNSKSVYGVFVTKGFYAVSVGAQKNLFNKKGTLKIVVNDVFQTRQRRQTARYENLDMNGHIRFDSRMVTFSFSYRFGKDMTPARKRKSGSEDIQGRVTGG